MDGIFISYRRDDSAGYAGRLYDRLAAQFGADRVFMDVAGIELGTDFVTAIEQAVGSCQVLVVVIGDEWLSTTDAAGRRRLDDPHDFVRLETGVALEREIRLFRRREQRRGGQRILVFVDDDAAGTGGAEWSRQADRWRQRLPERRGEAVALFAFSVLGDNRQILLSLAQGPAHPGPATIRTLKLHGA